MNQIPPRANLTVAEIAAFLGVSDSTVYEALHTGEIPWFKIKGQYRIPRDEFLERRAAQIRASLALAD